ncbi:uroporphyrinogen-III synthase [Novispirillum itersonii]|uniref:uroporphyrinogen-III synthase n=1 Tax=Novispirillum itersonii TaxID=189 RepID=UPI000382D1D5|nr:uroporphyrinogen-III synthase [Novispirillum itersonii]
MTGGGVAPLRIAVTRPEEDAARTAALLRGMGHTVLIEPLLTVQPLDVPLPPPQALGGLLLTSANGVRMLNRAAQRLPALQAAALRALPAYAVGDQTARALRDFGFHGVLSADGDVGVLAALVRRTHPADGLPLLHVAGTDRAGDLAALLAPEYPVQRAVLYRAETAAAFSPAFVQALTGRLLDVVLLYSPRTAVTFTALVDASGLKDHLRVVTAACLSHTVAKSLDGLPFSAVLSADQPRQDALLALLGNVTRVTEGRV